MYRFWFRVLAAKFAFIHYINNFQIPNSKFHYNEYNTPPLPSFAREVAGIVDMRSFLGIVRRFEVHFRN